MKVLLVTDVDDQPVGIFKNRTTLKKYFNDKYSSVDPEFTMDNLNVNGDEGQSTEIHVLWEDYGLDDINKQFVADFSGTVTITKVQ